MVYESLSSWMVRMSGVGEWKCQGGRGSVLGRSGASSLYCQLQPGLLNTHPDDVWLDKGWSQIWMRSESIWV